jgi:hypothetical protein
MQLFRQCRQRLCRVIPCGFASVLMMAVASPVALGQAYTYQNPTCGGTWRDEPSKPQELRVVWEMTAAQACVQENKFSLACRHLQSGIAAADRMGPEAGGSDGIKTYMKVMMRTHGCQ